MKPASAQAGSVTVCGQSSSTAKEAAEDDAGARSWASRTSEIASAFHPPRRPARTAEGTGDPMNRDTLKGQWLQVKGKAKQQWGKLTDDDLTQIEGNADLMIGKLQERYGYSREQAERELDSQMTAWGDTERKAA